MKPDTQIRPEYDPHRPAMFSIELSEEQYREAQICMKFAAPGVSLEAFWQERLTRWINTVAVAFPSARLEMVKLSQEHALKHGREGA